MSTKNCHSCLKRGGQHYPVYAACYECREFYCNTCSGIHPTFKPTEGHTIYRLLLPAINPPVNNENKLASDFLKTDDEDPPYAAQVVVKSREGKGQSKHAALPRSDKKSSRQADPGDLKARRCRDINVKRSDYKARVDVRGVLTVAGQVVVVDNGSKMLKLFNDSGAYLSSTALKDYTSGITRVSDDTFATCGVGKTVYLWNIHGQTVTRSDVTYRVQYNAHGIMYDGTYYCVLHSLHNSITILDWHWKHLKHIKLEKGEISLGWDICMDDHSHNIYVPCRGYNGGVLCVSVQGEPLWFTPVSSRLRGITEIHGVLCVADDSGCLHLLSKAGMSSTALKDYTSGITRVSDDTFATCGHSNTVYIWNIHGQTVTRSDVTYRVQYNAHGIMYDGTYYCVLYRKNNTITILDRQGQHVKHIKVEKAFGKEITFGYDIHMDDHSHDIYVPCRGYNGGVLCVSAQGQPLWYTPVSSNLWGITEIRGVLCVTDRTGRCLHLLSKAGEYECKLKVWKDMDGRPQYINYDGQGEKLYVSYSPIKDKHDVISVYSVTC